MRYLIVPVLAAAMAVGLMGCDDSPEARDLRKKTGDAVDAAGKYLSKQKEELAEATTEKLGQLQSRLDDLKKAAEAKGEDARAEFEKLKPELEKKINAAREKLSKLKDSGAEAWTEVKSGLKSAMEDLGQACDRAAAKMKGEDGPDADD